MNRNQIISTILCGQAGMGKTFFSQTSWVPAVMFQSGNPIAKLSTLGVVENALSSITTHLYPSAREMVSGMKDLISKGYTFIIDNAEIIPCEALMLIINTILASNADHCHIVFIFDVTRRNLLGNEIFRMLLEWNILAFSVLPNDFISSNTSEFILENIPTATPELIDEIETLAGKNFNLMIRLLWLHQLNEPHENQLSQITIEQYTNIYTDEMLKRLPEDLRLLLSKSSIVGEIFSKNVLESPTGFNISGVKLYLDKVMKISALIDRYINDDLYKFESSEVHQSVFKSIEPKERIQWTEIVINYYLNRYHSRQPLRDKLLCVKKLSLLSSDINNRFLELMTNCNLLFEYSTKDDVENALLVFQVLSGNPYLDIDPHLRDYLTVWIVRYLISKSLFINALEIINGNDHYYIRSVNRFVLQYYKAFCLFNCGNVDESYSITIQLCESFGKEAEIQSNKSPIFAMAFSLMATLQNHFGIDDNGLKCYSIALNHSRQKVQDKSIFYSILKKADMFYSYPISCDYIRESIVYFSNGNHTEELGELYINLATETLFQEEIRNNEVKEYLDMAVKAFIHFPNERLSYAYNNTAIFYIMSSSNYARAIELLENAMFVGMSDFTYMTLYVNLCMCYLKVYGVKSEKLKQAYASFEVYYNRIKCRQNSTQYEEVYKKIVDLIICEYLIEDKTTCQSYAQEILSIHPSPFFLPLIQDIINRTSTAPQCADIKYKDNSNYYIKMASERIFLAEFRFWE